jgi:hypothetical protein
MSQSPRFDDREQRGDLNDVSAGSGSTGTPTRRRWIALCGGAALTGLAGCGGDDAGGGGGGGSGSGGDESAGEGDAEAGGEAGDGDGSSSDDGDAFGDVLQFESAFVMEGYIEQEDGPRNEITVRVNGNDTHWRLESDGKSSEIYSVDGDNYIVSGEECLLNRGAGPDQGFTAQQFEEDRSAEDDVTPTGQETIDGTDVLVYEIASDEDDVTYYLDAETGYPVRVETSNGAFDFSSWGDVEPIGTPAMECQDPSQG